jgi:hypothetical protein
VLHPLPATKDRHAFGFIAMSVVLAVTLLAALSVTPVRAATIEPRSACASSSCGTTWTKFQARFGDVYVGPSAYTQYGVEHIYGYTAVGATGFAHPRFHVGWVSPATLMAARTVQPVGPSGPVIGAYSWYNPASWDWGHIMGSAWNSFWDGCVRHGSKAVASTASVTVIVNLMARGGAIYVGPYGYAAVAVGGCLVNYIGS